MQWTSQAIIIKYSQFNEDKLLCWLFSETHGLYKGLLSLNKKTRNQIQLGNIVEATWRARLPEHLGTYYCELIKPLSMSIIEDRSKLSSILSLCSLLVASLPEKTIETTIYDHSISYLLALKDHQDWLLDYLKLELNLLQELGYGLDLNSCAISGSKDDLYYISPKTGRAASRSAGVEYHEKLLILPEFFTSNKDATKEDVINGFKLTRFFLEKHLFKPYNKELPDDRARFETLFL